jgi:hypothetical protein
MVAIRRNWLVIGLALLLLVVTFVYLIPGINQPVNIYDEGIITYSAVRVMQGQVPYRDFWSIYSPAQFYGLAAAFRLFGTTIQVERLWDTAMRALVAVAAFLLVWRLSKRRAALVAWFTVMVWVAYYSFSSEFHWVFYGYPAFPAIALCLGSILCLTVYFSNGCKRWLVAGGVIIGVAALFRHDFGIYCAIGEGLALVLFGLLHNGAITIPSREGLTGARLTGVRLSREGLTRMALVIGIFAVSAAVVVLPAVIYFVALTPINELVYDLFTFPLVTFPRYRALPFPAFSFPETLAFYLPFLVYAIAGAVAFVQLRRRNFAYALAILMLIVFGVCSFNQARVRADLIHTPAFFLPAVVLMAVLLGGIPRREGESMDAAQVLSSLAVLLFVLVLAQPIGDRVALLADAKLMRPTNNSGLERSRTAIVGSEMANAIYYIDTLTTPQDKIYVGNATHDRVFVNEPMFYFLAQRDAATRYHELHPGVATTAPVQTEIANDLEKNQVKYLVLSNAYEEVREPNESAVSSGVKILDNYIAEHYLPVMQIGPYAIWKRQ